jgi:hypothetical protein
MSLRNNEDVMKVRGANGPTIPLCWGPIALCAVDVSGRQLNQTVRTSARITQFNSLWLRFIRSTLQNWNVLYVVKCWTVIFWISARIIYTFKTRITGVLLRMLWIELSLFRKNISPAVSFRKLVNILVPSRCTVWTMHINLKIIFLCAGKISIDQRVGIIAVRETTFSEPQREKYFEGLGSHVDEQFTSYQISVGRYPVSQHGIITSRQTTC